MDVRNLQNIDSGSAFAAMFNGQLLIAPFHQVHGKSLIMWDLTAQIFIAVLGLTAIILLARDNRWGFVAGLLSQPFWFITTFANEQWAIFLLSVVYAGTWGYGVWRNFFKKNPPLITPHDPGTRDILDELTKGLRDSRPTTIVIDNEFTADGVHQLLKSFEELYQTMGGQAIHFRFTAHGLVAKPSDKPTW